MAPVIRNVLGQVRNRIDLRYAMDQLDSTKAPVIGTLLNDIDLRRNARDDGSYRYLAEAARYNVTSG